MKETVVIQNATQLPITNTKAIPGNYNKVVVTHKGKEIIDETNARGFDPTVICEYHANAPGHSTENYWTLKRVIEKLIEDKVIEVRNEEAPNVNNLLPAYNNERVVGMVDIFEDYEQTSRTKVERKVSKEDSSMVLEPIQRAPIIIKGARSNLGTRGS